MLESFENKGNRDNIEIEIDIEIDIDMTSNALIMPARKGRGERIVLFAETIRLVSFVYLAYPCQSEHLRSKGWLG